MEAEFVLEAVVEATVDTTVVEEAVGRVDAPVVAALPTW